MKWMYHSKPFQRIDKIPPRHINSFTSAHPKKPNPTVIVNQGISCKSSLPFSFRPRKLEKKLPILRLHEQFIRRVHLPLIKLFRCP